MDENNVLVSASIYNEQYFVNPYYNSIPKEVLEELRIICITLSAKLHCIFTIGFNEEGNIFINTKSLENDLDYDEIGAKLEINKLLKEKKGLIRALELWYRVFIINKGKDLEKLKENFNEDR